MNLFSRVDVDAAGAMHFHAGNSAPGAAVELRAEMDVLVVLDTCQHPLDPNPAYAPKPARLELLKTPPPGPDDFCRNSCPQNARAFTLTERLFPVSTLIYTESTRDPAQAVYDLTLLAGEGWLHEIKQGQTFRIVDLEGNQAVDTLFYNAADLDRSLQRAGHHPRARRHLSHHRHAPDQQRRAACCSPSSPTPAAATTRSAAPARRRATRCATRSTNAGCMPAATRSCARIGRSGLAMTKCDITHNINFFMNVPVTPEGGLSFEDGVSAGGRYVEMRAEMDVIALISNCPQLNNPCNAYNPTPVRLLIWD